MSTKENLSEALTTVQEYRGAPLYLAFIKLLDAIDAEHLEDLLTAPLERVQHVQGAAAQGRALRLALVHAGLHTWPIG
ncbi:hypothetical protein [Janthinobacterium sp. CG3]|uniref:hypothetical protein n=1 Tax=Janthinobacterium sp. CG3 TaxID=1075768 RepID=UPI000363409E|nr:hypothetical protein [Janthinobacterium sp. CG3]